MQLARDSVIISKEDIEELFSLRQTTENKINLTADLRIFASSIEFIRVTYKRGFNIPSCYWMDSLWFPLRIGVSCLDLSA